MIFDTATAIWTSVDQLGPEVASRFRECKPDRWGLLDASMPAHEEAMGAVDGSFVFGFRSDRLGACIPNELIAEFISRDPARRIGIAGIDPMADDAMASVDRALELGLSGVAVSPACQGFHPSHSAAMRIYERCVDLKLPVFATVLQPLTSGSMMTFGQPALWDEIAVALPELPIVISQLGYPWVDETLVLLSKHRNVYADISSVISRPWQLYNALLSASSLGVMDKLLFGSGFPFDTPAHAIEQLYTVNAFNQGTPLPTIPRTALRAIVERDVLEALNMAREFETRTDLRVPTGEPAVTVVESKPTPAAHS